MHTNLRRVLRKTVAHALYYSGFLWLLAAVKLRRRVVVLMYHRVLPRDADTFSSDGIIVTRETFARHLRFLKFFFRPLSLDQFTAALLQGEHMPSRGCLITFDDGWHDNVMHALPLLRAHDMPAVVFLATDYIGTSQCFWQERIARKMFHAVDFGDEPRALVEAQTSCDLRLLSPEKRRHAIRAVVTDMKQWPPESVARFEASLDDASSIVGALPPDPGEDRFMDWSDASRLVPPNQLVAAAHGCSHIRLTSLDNEQLAHELRESRLTLHSAVGGTVTAIAYPNGNVDDRVVRMAREVGYQVGFTTQRGLVSKGDDALRLHRINIHEASAASVPELLCVILGVFRRWPTRA